MTTSDKPRANKAAKDVSFYTPSQEPPAGTAKNEKHPSLFSSIHIGPMKIHNRIVVSPMCQYSADDGHATQWHESLIGSLATRGPGLIMMEAHAVSPEGRITAEDAGLWIDSHIPPLKRITEFSHSQGVKIGIQLQHAGRKASRLAPWLDRQATWFDESYGWPEKVISCGPDPMSHRAAVPREMTKDDIAALKESWTAAAKRAVKAGFDTIMFQASSGYLLHCFLSPVANHRGDEYGGSFENRIRLLLELVHLVQDNIPAHIPVCVRIPASDNLEHLADVPSWTVEEAMKLARILAEAGVSFLDVSSGAIDLRQKMEYGEGYQVNLARLIKSAVAGSGTVVGVSGGITNGQQAQGILDTASSDVAVVGRAFLKDPNLVWHWADQLEVKVHVASQLSWGFGINRRSNL
ncbi:hypothetical protein F66182_8893 [Fusarium sp. NRRL 66182]|nr:hypothetical protein F66182_8893 [Fusarium sp. NRRL 66182]